MLYICKKLCAFNGKEYLPGDMIPDSEILPFRAKAMISNGYIASAEAAIVTEVPSKPIATIIVPLKVEDGIIEADMDQRNLVHAIEIMQENADEAVNLIKEETELDVLLVLSILDSRKTVNKAADARAKELTTAVGKDEEQTDGEQ